MDKNDKNKIRKRLDLSRPESIEIGKLPPQAVDLEEAVLGAILLEDDAYHEVADLLFPEAFYKEQNALVCQAIINLKNKGEHADLLTVVDELKRTGDLESAGGAYYVSQLTNRIASSANIEMHMRLVHEPYIKRESIRASTELIKNCYETGSDALDIIDQYEKALTDLTTKLFTRKSEDSATLFQKVVTHNEIITSSPSAVIGVPVGFLDLDRLTGGFRPGDLIVLAGRPGMGKTAMAVCMGRNTATIFNKPVAIFSLEMSGLQLFQRMCSQETEIPLEQFTTTGMDAATMITFHRTAEKLKTAPIFIDDTGGQTIFDIRNKARKLKREKHIEMIIIDYLQLIDGGSDKSGNREQEVSMISRSLKALAKELEVPIIALAQLSRQVETRAATSNIPKLSDLRDSGSIEQDADMVMFIYRPEYYGMMEDGDGKSTLGMAKVIIAKNRNGALDDVDMRWKAECTLFQDFNFNYLEQIPTGPAPMQNNENFLL